MSSNQFAKAGTPKAIASATIEFKAVSDQSSALLIWQVHEDLRADLTAGFVELRGNAVSQLDT